MPEGEQVKLERNINCLKKKRKFEAPSKLIASPFSSPPIWQRFQPCLCVSTSSTSTCNSRHPSMKSNRSALSTFKDSAIKYWISFRILRDSAEFLREIPICSLTYFRWWRRYQRHAMSCTNLTDSVRSFPSFWVRVIFSSQDKTWTYRDVQLHVCQFEEPQGRLCVWDENAAEGMLNFKWVPKDISKLIIKSSKILGTSLGFAKVPKH